MTYRGRVHNNIIALPPDVSLPEGTEVLIEPVGAASQPAASLLDHLGDLVGSIDDLPNDFAPNHEHQRHGTME